MLILEGICRNGYLVYLFSVGNCVRGSVGESSKFCIASKDAQASYILVATARKGSPARRGVGKIRPARNEINALI